MLFSYFVFTRRESFIKCLNLSQSSENERPTDFLYADPVCWALKEFITYFPLDKNYEDV